MTSNNNNYKNIDSSNCCYSSELQNLRTAAAREILGAVYHYFVSSRESLDEPYDDDMTFQEYLAHEAEDEMIHYLDEIRRISKLDIIQKQEFIEHGLEEYLVGDKWPPITFWYGPYNDTDIDERTRRWLKTIDHVINAIAFELETINVYEKFIKEAKCNSTKKIFIEAMNHEKGDLADFNQMLFKLLHTDKPSPPEE